MDEFDGRPENRRDEKRRFGWPHLIGVFLLALVVTALLAAWWISYFFYASGLKPTQLSRDERQVLETKLKRLGVEGQAHDLDGTPVVGEKEALTPEPYSEAGASREVVLSEKELNALIANDPEMAKKVAIHLAKDLVSLRLVLPIDEEVLILGGKTLRLRMGVKLKFEAERPVVALQGVSLGGIPLPNAWLGELKYRNLVEEFGSDNGFWQSFSAGVADLQVEEGQLRIRLKK